MKEVSSRHLMPRIGTIFLTWKRFLQRKLVSHDMSLKQHYLLRRLCSGNTMTPSEIAEKLFCDRPTATVVIRNLEKKGWAIRRKDPDNGRSVLVEITEAGRSKYAEVEHVLDTDFNPLSCFSPDEREILDKLLLKLRNHLSQLD